MASFNGYVELPDGRYGEFHKWWYPQMDGFIRENKKKKTWMRTGGTPILGNHHMAI